MPLFNNLETSAAPALKPVLGSFWTERFGDNAHVDTLLGLTMKCKVMGMFRSYAANLMGDVPTARLEKFVDEPFNPASVTTSGQLLFDDPDLTLTYPDQTQVTWAYNLSSMQYFVLPIIDYIPRVIQGPSAKLILGIDFFIVGNQWMFFRQDPRLMFPDSILKMHLAERVNFSSLNAFLLRANPQDDQQYLLRYYRTHQTPKAFALALAAVGGLKITHYNQTLRAMRSQGATTVYVFDRETIRVPYQHTPLVVGQGYAADTIIGNGVQVFYDTGTGKDWWRAVDWGVGISLDPILTSFKGLSLLDQDTVAYPAGYDSGSVNGSKVHAQLQLTGDFYNEQKYWNWVAARETELGYYLNGFLNLPEVAAVENLIGYNTSTPFLTLLTEDFGLLFDTISDSDDYGMITDTVGTFDDYGSLVIDVSSAVSIPIYEYVSNTFANLLTEYAAANALNASLGWQLEQPDVRSLTGVVLVNALDTFFRATLQKKGLVIFIQRDQICNLKEFYTFLNREMLAGVVPVVYSVGPSLGVENFAFGSTIVANDSVVLSPSTPLTLMESVNLPAIMTDTVVL